MQIHNPRLEDLVELTSRVSAAFGYNKEEPGVSRDFPQLYSSNNFNRLWIASQDKGIAAHAGFYPAVMRVEGVPLPVAGIGGVFTAEEYQGQGLASSLVKKCAEEAAKEGAALAFLWSDKHEFYKKNGFHLLGRQWTIDFQVSHAPFLRRTGEKAEIPGAALRYSDEVSIELLKQSHALLEIYPIGIVRSPEEHAMYLSSGSCRVVSAWAGNELAAYFVIGKGRDLTGYIHEWAGAEGALSHLLAQCLEDFQQPLHLLSPQFMRDEVPWIYSLEEGGIPFRPEYLALVKLLNFEKLKKLLDLYLKRLGQNPSDLVMEKEGEDYSVAWKGKPARLFSEAALMRLLFGPELPDDRELHAFLPLRIWYWGMDSV